MENLNKTGNREEKSPEYLRQRKAENLRTLEKRIHELEIEKQKRMRVHDKKEGMV